MSSPTEFQEEKDDVQDDIDMHPPAAEDAAAGLGLQDLANSGADHSAVAGGQTAAPGFVQQTQPQMVSSSYPGTAPQAPLTAVCQKVIVPVEYTYCGKQYFRLKKADVKDVLKYKSLD